MNFDQYMKTVFDNNEHLKTKKGRKTLKKMKKKPRTGLHVSIMELVKKN